MKRVKLLIISLLICLTFPMCAVYGADYKFEGAKQKDYYKPTLYDDMFDAEYRYGGPNLVDYYRPIELPGYKSSGYSSIAPSITVVNTGNASGNYPAMPASSTDINITPISALTRPDGSIGTVYIPSIGISVKAFEGATDESMAKGIGHFAETSAWNGNPTFCGHNRGAKYAIGKVADLKIGDTITYTTDLGTRRYEVVFNGRISSTDWSYTSQTSDNRITLITCVANQPSVRVCVQAKEVI